MRDTKKKLKRNRYDENKGIDWTMFGTAVALRDGGADFCGGRGIQDAGF